MELRTYIEECGKSANKKGWKVTWDSLPEYLLCTIAELTDAHEKGWRDDKKEKTYEEIGDCFVRLFHICHDLDIPLEEILKKLMKNNERRAYKHGHTRI